MNKPQIIYSERVHQLRALLQQENLDGFIVPRADEYQGEEVPACAERLAWLTGFTGSAGVAAIMQDRAVVLSDGRYTIQLRDQTDPSVFEVADSTRSPVAEWIACHAKKGMVIGYDPRLHTPDQLKGLREKLEVNGVTLKAVDVNPVDKIWTDQSLPPESSVRLFPEKYAGWSFEEKLKKVVSEIEKQGAGAAVLTLPDSVAWLLNIRGSDLKHTPVVLSYALVRTNPARVDWFVAPERVSSQVHKSLGKSVRIIGPHALEHEIADLAANSRDEDKAVLLDNRHSPIWFLDALEEHGAKIKNASDPCIALKALKNEAEQKAMINAHRRDGKALILFMAWLEAQNVKEARLTETTIAEKLEEYRQCDALYLGPSFNTISGFGANGAIVHYRAEEASAATLEEGSLLLLDSGGQYEDGTTDVTRTIAIGEPTEDMRRHYTLVLKSHIAVAVSVFPDGTPGSQIDAMARKPLWDNGLDYAHGTGHGVGCCLNVHEEAASLSPRSSGKIRAGMVLSNEPGYYHEGAYGIRIENLILAEPTGSISNTGIPMLRFKTLTLAPLDRRLIVPEMLDDKEKHWLNAYHGRVWKEINKGLDKNTASWLRNAVTPV